MSATPASDEKAIKAACKAYKNPPLEGYGMDDTITNPFLPEKEYEHVRRMRAALKAYDAAIVPDQPVKMIGATCVCGRKMTVISNNVIEPPDDKPCAALMILIREFGDAPLHFSDKEYLAWMEENEPSTLGILTSVAEEIKGLYQTPARQSSNFNKGEFMLTDEQIKHMRDRFLGWKLPENFSPDGGISFAKKPHNHINEPYGTNVFDAQQAEEMIRYMLDGLTPAAPDYVDGRKYMQRIPAEEPVFVLRAQDKLASHFVRQWAVVAKDKGLSDERYENAMKLADAMKAWPIKKLPD